MGSSPGRRCLRLDEALRSVDEAEHELDLFVTNPKLITWSARRSSSRESTSDSEHSTRHGGLSPSSGGRAPRRRTRRRRPSRGLAHVDGAEKRRLMHGLLDRVVVRRADRRGRNANPITERTQIVLRGNVLSASHTQRQPPLSRATRYLPERSMSSTRYESGPSQNRSASRPR